MTSSDTLYVILFVAVFPALWILARVLERVVPDNSEHHSPRQERERKQEHEALALEAHQKTKSLAGLLVPKKPIWRQIIVAGGGRILSA